MNDYTQLEDELGIEFRDKSLLQRALTHRSYLNEHPEFPLEDNERLEFLGDAVLDFMTGEYLYHRFPELREGLLTSLRSVLVRRDTLARFARELGLGEYLLMGHGEIETGGRGRAATLCAAFEALVGALYLDQGLASVDKLLAPLVAPEVVRTLKDRSLKDAKSLLQELAQARTHQTPRYKTIAETGPDHAKEFTVQVTISGKVYGEGYGSNKQQAAQAAAQEALDRLEEEDIEDAT
ncbi:MAG: ribonuclease III [Anaerolineae bacterium]|nr:ribonuclease III [Anaerolineae bacterium]